MKGRTLDITLLEPLPKPFTSYAITVDNVAGLSDDLLMLYFESSRQSNGGLVKCVSRNEDGKAAVVCFNDKKGINANTE
jgi:hypothetical protein